MLDWVGIPALHWHSAGRTDEEQFSFAAVCKLRSRDRTAVFLYQDVEKAQVNSNAKRHTL